MPPRKRNRRDALTQQRLLELVAYDPETGEFKWRFSRGGVHPGKCGRISKSHGYLDICVDYILYRAHRLAFLYMTGRFPEALVDHENRIKTDNRWCNLREATTSQNSSNVGIKPKNTSGAIGVYWSKPRNKWQAQIRIDGRKTNLGRFPCMDEAIFAHDVAAISSFGDFAQTNWPKDFYAAV